MKTIRYRVRAVVFAWLLCQVASLSAFAPDNCCISHVQEQAAKDEACHEGEPVKPEPPDTCPMQHGDGAACPMHSSKPADRCSMTNACAGPGAHLVSLFAYLGAIEAPVSAVVNLDSTPAIMPASTSPLFRVSRPASPPPKA